MPLWRQYSFDYAGGVPFGKNLLDIGFGLRGGDFIFVAEAGGECLGGEIAHLCSFAPEIGGGVVEHEEFAEVDGREPFADDYRFAAHVAQQESIFNSHRLLYIVSR